jgi:NAD(P)-dependent dehydrogenase (short-subunit alcohol dehydrogenase family)
MKKTVLITGTSSGIGRATVFAFSKAGWNVAATLRNPQKETELQTLPGVHLFALDVTDSQSVERAFEATLKQFGRIDAVVNNAGYGVDGIFEAMDDATIEKQYQTNVFGLMRVTREAIKVMRPQGGGTILQISSMGGRLAFPLFSIYHGTKWAVEGFTESLQYELIPFNIRLKLIEPGAIKTEFYGSSRQMVVPDGIPEYREFVDKALKVNNDAGMKGDRPETVAQTIVKAASDQSSRLRYATGSPAPALLFLRRVLPFGIWKRIVHLSYGIR